MGYCALDLSKSSTGFAVWQDGWDKPRYGSWQLGTVYTCDGRTFAALHGHLSDLRALCRFERLYFEEPINPAQLSGNTNIGTLRVLAGLAAHAESFGEAVGCRTVMRINVSSWRGSYIGPQKRGTKSKTLKDLTMERCRQLGFTPRKTDEADALGLLTYAILLSGVTPPWLANETLRPMLAGAAA
jgi:hypothetical protein